MKKKKFCILSQNNGSQSQHKQFMSSITLSETIYLFI